MKIIREGNSEGIKRFECKNCGCCFECVIPNIDIGTKNYYYAEKDKKDKDYSKE